MQILNISLQSMFLSGLTDDVIADTSAGTDTTAPAASIDARVSPEEVEKSFVAVGLKRTHHEKLAQFTFFLLDNKPECLADGYFKELQRHDKLDDRRHTVDRVNAHAAGKRCKEATQTVVWKYLIECIRKVQPARQGQSHNSPIKLNVNGAITYKVVREFMHTKTNVINVECDAAEKYLAEIKNGLSITADMIGKETGKVTLTVYQGASTFSAIQSAIAYLYKLAGAERPANDVADIAKFVGGMKRIVQAAKMHLGLKLTEGKLQCQ